MQATLLNFGDCTRVVCDTMNRPLAINIGEVVDMDIHEAHFHVIKRGVGTDSLMIVPKDVRVSDKLQSIIDVLKAIETEPYDALLQRYNEVAPYMEDADHAMRPSRDNMRVTLRDLARVEVGKALHMQSKVVIREQGDEVTRQPVVKDDVIKEVIPEVKAPAPDPAPRKRKASSSKSSKPAVKRERL
jgi:hypothetical protein